MLLACETGMTPNIRRRGGKNRRIWGDHGDGLSGNSSLHSFCTRYRWDVLYRVSRPCHYDAFRNIKRED